MNRNKGSKGAATAQDRVARRVLSNGRALRTTLPALRLDRSNVEGKREKMKRQLLILASALVLVALFTTESFASEITVRGRLGRTVEAGGWLILTDTDKYLILNPQRFQNEPWFRETTEVEATGEVKRDAVTIYQEGIPFEVSSMRPVGGGGGGGATGGAMESKRMTRVLVAGDAIIQAQPDTAILVIAVVTQNKNALNAQQENASRSEQVVRALKAAAGAGAEIKTSGYSIQPQRVYKENMPPTITGYEARNSVTVTMSDLNRVGAVIDAAAQAGANNVDSVSFTLRQDRPARAQALTEATLEAVSKAQTIAQALGGRVLRIVEVQEDGVRPRPVVENTYTRDAMVAQASTPIEVGTLEITSRALLIAEIETGR
jgi:uncharacterized protein